MIYFAVILYAVWGLLIAVNQIAQIIRNRTIKLINFANLMYSFVYGIVPVVILFSEVMGIDNKGIDTSSTGLWKLIVILIMSVFAHFWMNLAYRGTKIKYRPPVTSEKTTFRAGWIMLLGGFAALFLWTRAAGGVFEFIDIAPGLRGRYEVLNNPLAFMQHFAQILMLAACIMVSYWLQNKRKIWVIIPAMVALYGAFLFAMAWDSRAAFGFVAMMIALVYVEYLIQSKHVEIKRVIIMTSLFAVAAIILMVWSESFAGQFRGDETNEEISSNIFVIIREEFNYILRVQQRMLDAIFEPGFKLQILNDLVNAVTAWVPTRFIPFKLPRTLWSYNTLDLMGGTIYGTIPTDFVSACLLEMGVLGLLIIPIAMGWLLKKADGMLETEGYNFYRSNVKAALAMAVINKVSHFQLAGIPSSIFYVVLGHLVVVFCRTLENGGRLRVKTGERLS